MNQDATSPLPRVADEAVFREPWEAHAFALTVKLHERGLFTWAEWAEALSRQIRVADAGEGSGVVDSGERYYQHWLAALESLVATKGAASGNELDTYRQAWSRAAERTPHGQPIELTPPDFPDQAAGTCT